MYGERPFPPPRREKVASFDLQLSLGTKSPLLPGLTTGGQWWATWEQKTAVKRSS